MRPLILFIVFLLASKFSYSQIEIKLEDAPKHIGDSVKICGKVASMRFVENTEGQPTFINMGKPYPNQLLTVIVWGLVRQRFPKSLEELFNNKEICVTGKVELYKGKPQIVVLGNEQMSIKID